MSDFITLIDGVALYSKKESALEWSKIHGIKGYHKHEWQGIKGYMGGTSHSAAKEAIVPIHVNRGVNLKQKPAKPTVIEIIDNDLDKAIQQAKTKKLLREDIDFDFVRGELLTAMIKISKYREQLANVNVRSSEPLEQLDCKNCGSDDLGICVLGGCFSILEWVFPISHNLTTAPSTITINSTPTTPPQGKKIWENVDGKCYCHGHLMTNPGCHGANCRTCCYSLGKGAFSDPYSDPYSPPTTSGGSGGGY